MMTTDKQVTKEMLLKRARRGNEKGIGMWNAERGRETRTHAFACLSLYAGVFIHVEINVSIATRTCAWVYIHIYMLLYTNIHLYI